MLISTATDYFDGLIGSVIKGSHGYKLLHLYALLKCIYPGLISRSYLYRIFSVIQISPKALCQKSKVIMEYGLSLLKI